jgi:hypothetical protein
MPAARANIGRHQIPGVSHVVIGVPLQIDVRIDDPHGDVVGRFNFSGKHKGMIAKPDVCAFEILAPPIGRHAPDADIVLKNFHFEMIIGIRAVERPSGNP